MRFHVNAIDSSRLDRAYTSSTRAIQTPHDQHLHGRRLQKKTIWGGANHAVASNFCIFTPIGGNGAYERRRVVKTIHGTITGLEEDRNGPEDLIRIRASDSKRPSE